MKIDPPPAKSELRANLRLACEALLDKKAQDLKLLYFGDSSPLTDCFVIATGTSDPHLKALRDNLEKTLKDNQIELYSRDRFQSSGWLVLDAIDFVVHLFSSEQRQNYALESLWKDALDLSPDDL
ncbi:MAG TPA: ribosome silencing factor [Opitutae bacterium]|nr:ribosome silencing factor [Opitutae bacterium]|tara:strand:+ start:789 stop:1163 length:375 start_codon:yes stop_codon:yes gene_type:complete